MEGLLRLREQGKIRAIGFCNIDCELLRRALRVGRVDTIQAAYSLLNREIEGELIPLCRDHGVAVWAYWAMERGLLSGSTPSRGTLLRNDHRRWDYRFSRSSRRRVREAFEKAGQDEDFAAWPPARLALAWALHAPGVEAVLVGATSPQEVRANGGALDVPLSEEQRQRLAACFASCAQALARPSLEKQGFKVVGWALAKIAMWRAP